MDYKMFFWDMFLWTQEVNEAAKRHGYGSSEFWVSVAESCAAICQKYNDHKLAVKQMAMMIEWLEDLTKNA